MLPFCWFFMGLIKHYGMTVVNIHGIEPPQQRHHRKAIAQNQALVADALFSNDGHRSPRCFVIHDAGG